MDTDEQIDAFEEDLDKLLERYMHEFDLPLVSVIGVLHCKIYEITSASYEED